MELDDILAIVERYDALAEHDTPLDRLARLFGLPEYEPGETVEYELYDLLGFPLLCDICGGNHWIFAESEWICDHSRDEEYLLVPMPVMGIVKCEKVSTFCLINDDLSNCD